MAFEKKSIEASGPIGTDERIHPDDRSRINGYRSQGWEVYTVLRSETPPRYLLRREKQPATASPAEEPEEAVETGEDISLDADEEEEEEGDGETEALGTTEL